MRFGLVLLCYHSQSNRSQKRNLLNSFYETDIISHQNRQGQEKGKTLISQSIL